MVKQYMNTRYKDLTGQKFGRLKVLERYGTRKYPSGNSAVVWKCQCDCGNISFPLTRELTSGKTKSCGCLGKENASKAKRKYNEYDLSGEYGIGYATNTNKEFYFDLEDYDKIKDYCWAETPYGYIKTKTKNYNIALHRLIMNVGNKKDNNVDVDHIGGKETVNDNRKSNLRICTHAENMRNMKLHIDNKSGETGVIWDEKHNCWHVEIKVNYKNIFLGCYDNYNDAVAARKYAEEIYFGEYSRDNSQGIVNEIYNPLLKKRTQYKPVVAIETNKIYLGVNVATKLLNKSGSNISKCVNGERNIAYGCHWRYATEEEVNKYYERLLEEKCIELTN